MPSKVTDFGTNQKPVTRLAFNPAPTEGFPWDDLRKTFRGCQLRAKVSDGVETLPEILTG